MSQNDCRESGYGAHLSDAFGGVPHVEFVFVDADDSTEGESCFLKIVLFARKILRDP